MQHKGTPYNRPPCEYTLYKLIAPLIIVAIVLTLPTTSSASDFPDEQWYRENGVNVFNPIKTFPLSGLDTNGAPKGFAIDVWEKWSGKTGIPINHVILTWAETINRMETGDPGVHGALFFNDERNGFMDFSASYISLQAALIVRKSKDAPLETIFKDYRIGVLHRGFAQSWLTQNHPETKLVAYPTTGHIAKALSIGEIDAAAGDNPTIGYELAKTGHRQGFTIKKILYEEKLYAGVAKGNTVLLQLVNNGFEQISGDEIDYITRRWFVAPAEEDGWLWQILAVSTILLVGIAVYFFAGSKRTRSAGSNR